MLLLLLLVMLSSCAADMPPNLSNKMFTFPEESKIANAKVYTARQDMSAATVCLRSFTDLKRDHSLFSLATRSTINGFVIFKKAANGVFDVTVKDSQISFEGLAYELNTWHSICSTWDGRSGIVQLWVDGMPSSRKCVYSGSNINESLIVVLGQKQNSYGGAFHIEESFSGMITDVHVWDYTFSPCEIQTYSKGFSFTPGNVLSWNAFPYQGMGKVVTENKQESCQKIFETRF